MDKIQAVNKDDSIKLAEIYFSFCRKWGVLPESLYLPWVDQYYELTQPKDSKIEEKIDEVGGKIIAHFFSEFKRSILKIRFMPIVLMFLCLLWPNWVKKTYIINGIGVVYGNIMMNKRMNPEKANRRAEEFEKKLLELCRYFPSLN